MLQRLTRCAFAVLSTVFTVLLVSSTSQAAELQSTWHQHPDRVWIGPEFWANPMEDWRLKDGRLECVRTGPGRNVHVLTHQLGADEGTLEMSVLIGLQDGSTGGGTAGFEIGIRSELGDYRSSLIRGGGFHVGITTGGEVLYGTARTSHATVSYDDPEPVLERLTSTGLLLKLKLEPNGDVYQLSCALHDPETGELIYPAGNAVLQPDDVVGNIALAHNVAAGDNGPGTRARFWFRDWQLSGTKLTEDADQTFGPILYAMHTLSRGVLKLNAQMPPVGAADSQSVRLQIPTDAAADLLNISGDVPSDDDWTTIARATIDPLARTALFRIEDWPAEQDIKYRLVYAMQTTDGASADHTFQGTVRRDPVDEPSVSMAGFTGHKDTAFPNELIVSNVLKHDPDVLLFTGDQIYEDAGGFGIIREPADEAVLNYLRKIYLWGWSFRDILRDRPSLILPDDHDVYQGNIWGAGGQPVPGGVRDHDRGGFVEPPDFVNAVFRTQTGHHPDAWDPTPMLQGIDVFYGDMVYGRVSFAVIEDRYFKSGPSGKVNTWPGRADHVKDADFDTAALDRPGLVLLGERQLDFLNSWATDWRGSDMKCVCSQTIFCNLANYHGQNQEFIFADLDSNGWPQTGRNRALEAMRRGFAFHYAGDQHLASIVHHGIDDWGDAGFSFCVPSTAAGYPRSWLPDMEGRPVQNRPDAGLPDTGEYRDGFGNLVTVHAIGNPEEQRRRPVLELLHDKASGYGLVHFNKPDRTITIECFKLIFDANDPQPEDQFPGWPLTINMQDNDGRQPTAFLPTIVVTGLTNPVVQVIEEATGETLYALRISGTSFQPPVFADGTYTVHVGDPDANDMREINNLEPSAGNNVVRRINFN